MCQPKSKGGMRFQELEKFIEAMLGKQVWRLIHDTYSLFYRVFKANYFPNGSIFEAKVKSECMRGRVFSGLEGLSI